MKLSSLCRSSSRWTVQARDHHGIAAARGPAGSLEMVGLWLGMILLLVGGGPPLAVCAESDGLVRRQGDVRDLLMDVAKRMDRLADELEGTQPDEAQKLQSAAERVTVSRVEDTLKDVENLLTDSNFIEAVGRQDSVLDEIDKIISLLEEARFAESAGNDRLEDLQAARREVTRLANRQEELLRKTRKSLERSRARQALQDVARQLEKLEQKQAGLNEGQDPSSLDPGGARQDRAALERARERVDELLKGQEDILRRLGELPPEDPAAARSREVLEALKDLLSRAESLEDPAGDDPRKATEATRKLLEDSSDLAGRLEESGGETAEASRRLEEAAEEARKALEAAGESGKGAREAGQRLAEQVAEAGKSLQEALRSQQEAGSRESAALSQDQGLLERQTAGSSQQIGQEAQNARSESARSALAESSRRLEQATGSMQKSAGSLSRSRRETAQQEARQAQESLTKAREALSEGLERLESRDAREAAADLQKQLSREADEARERVETLQKKLGRDQQDPEREEDLDAAESALRQASESMQQAAAMQQRGEQAGAREQGKQASRALEQARKRLARKSQQEEAAGEEPLADNKEEQDELARLTRNVARKISESTGSESAESSNMQSAAGSMDRAGQDLAREDAESAEKNQQEALQKLRNSQKKLEQEEQQLAQLNREREMVSLMEELTGFRERQEKINGETVALKARQEPDPSRRDRLLFKRTADALATSQETLAQDLDTLNERLAQELSRVFHFVLQNVSSDMRQIVDLLRDSDLGDYTVFLGNEIVQDLAQLLESLKDELSRMQQQKQEGSPMPFDERRQRLVPVVAELRMLKEMQVEVNRRTRNLEDLRQAAESGVSDAWKKSLDRLLQKQGNISGMTGKLVEDFERISNAAEGEAAPAGAEPGEGDGG